MKTPHLKEKKEIEPYFKDAGGKLISYLKKYKKRITKLDYDFFIVVCGKERRGKSTLAIQIGEFMSDNSLTVEQICMDGEEFTKALQNSKKGSVIVFDEAGTNLYSREAMTSMNRMLTKAFMVSGLKNVCIILCIPSFFTLDSYIRTHRVDLLLYVTQRGKFKAYSHKRAKLISLLGSKMKKMNVTRAIEVGWFKKDLPNKELEKEYRRKEIKYKTGFIKDLKDLLEGYYTTGQFCKVTGYNLQTIYRWFKRKVLKYKKVGKKYFIPKSEADRVVKENPDSLEISKNTKEKPIK